MGRLQRVELENFKSYRGHQVIGPFHNFTSVIGPNGSGKSNLMDAISFVLGIKSSHLRSSSLKELIYRGEAMEDGTPETGANAQEAGRENPNNPTKASVLAVYVDDEQNETRFLRSVTLAGGSEYRLNERVVTYNTYSAALEKQNILVKARNFLVFQGDVEAIASQSPKDLTKLVEQISGSLDLKQEYEELKAQQELATENSTFNFNKKRGINAEIKQYQEQKAQAERLDRLQAERRNVVISLLLWKLFHLERNIRAVKDNIADKNSQVTLRRECQSDLEGTLRVARKEQAKLHREILKHEKAIKRKEKEADDMRPNLFRLEESIAHATRKAKNASDNQKKVRHNHDTQAELVGKLSAEFETVSKAEARYEETHAAKVKKGVVLSREDLAEYNKRKEEATAQTVEEQQRLDALRRQEKTDGECVARLREQIKELKKREQQLSVEETSQIELTEMSLTAVQQLDEDTRRVKTELETAEAERARLTQVELELKEKLAATANKLSQARTDLRESDGELKMKEAINTMKRLYPGIHGRLVDLCKPTQRKYDLAVSIVLGRHMKSIVVDEQKTALDCIQFLRDHHVGVCTFIPLDTIISKPVNDRCRSISPGARLAIDVIQYDAVYDSALHYACGNALLCDDLDIARDICYRRGMEVKAVTLDGTVISKNGLITGGQSGVTSNARRWEEKEVDELRKVCAAYQEKLNEIANSMRSTGQEKKLKSELTTLEHRLIVERDEMSVLSRKLEAIREEQRHVAAELARKLPELEKSSSNLTVLQAQMKKLDKNITRVVDKVFEDFCQRIQVANIREYEHRQLKATQEHSDMKVKFANQLSLLQSQMAYENQQLEYMKNRLQLLEETVQTEKEVLLGLENDKEEHLRETAKITNEIKTLREALKAASIAYDAKTEEVNSVKREVQKTTREVDGDLKTINTMESEIEKLNAERFSIFRKCKLEEIDLPLSSGRLDDVSFDLSSSIAGPSQRATGDDDNMDVDVDDGGGSVVDGSQTEPSLLSCDWPITVDFSDLDEEQKENGGKEIEDEFEEQIGKITEEIERLAPNMRAVDRLDGVEQRLRSTEEEFETARKESRLAKERFNTIKQERYNRFNAAYSHIAEKIDETYKALTKSRAFPLGGTAYLSLENSDEPYLDGIQYHAMPPMKRFRDMEQLSGGEKTVAALALLFAIHSYQPSPFFILDEVDAALDNANVGRVANFIREHASDTFQFIVISLKSTLYERAEALVGVYRNQDQNSSRVLTLNLEEYEE